MLHVPRLRAAARTLALCRGNASLSAAPTAGAGSTPAPHPHPQGEPKTAGRKTKRQLLKRAPISLDNPRTWNRPVTPGLIPAFDQALKYIQRDSANIEAESKELASNITVKEAEWQKAEGEAKAQLDAELESMREKLHILHVQSQVNLPEVRWKVRNAMADMSIPAHRHLVEHRWRKDGDLDLLMERIYQMDVVPDVLPEINPTIDLKVVVRTMGAQQLKEHDRKPEFNVEPGRFLDAGNTIERPRLYADVFHTDTRLYTMLLVDPDVPNPETASYTTFLHWLQPNVPLSASTTRISGLNNHTKYIPPHPQKGTPYHRYTVLLIPQPPKEGETYTRNTEARAKDGEVTSKEIEVDVIGEEGRKGFDVREFCERHGMSCKEGGAVHMWREVWSERTNKVYREILKQPEPVFGRPPKPDRYAEIRGRKKYIS
ncbi:PEBP-like protein [Coprinellus micaceus]|uniref:PEBP-like protein n=1 Tax=Coprinellus micaceus TaxID=71717 RepID=A0A4Y7SXF7_COPMI|nr:PEBP-like protein [Coprinellus micaceus]